MRCIHENIILQSTHFHITFPKNKLLGREMLMLNKELFVVHIKMNGFEGAE